MSDEGPPVEAAGGKVDDGKKPRQRGGGPKSARGRSRSKRNALAHGGYATIATLYEEQPEGFGAFQARMVAELVPVGILEDVLAARVILSAWRLRRLAMAETGVFRHEIDDLLELESSTARLVGTRAPQLSGIERLALAVIRDGRSANALGRIHAMEALIERTLYRNLDELRALQGERATKGQSIRDVG